MRAGLSHLMADKVPHKDACSSYKEQMFLDVFSENANDQRATFSLISFELKLRHP